MEKTEIEYVDFDRLETPFTDLQTRHPLLARYNLPERITERTEYRLHRNNDGVRVNDHRRHHFLLPNRQANLNAAGLNYNDLVMGIDSREDYVRVGNPAFLALLFPWIFLTCQGHYGLHSRSLREMRDSESSIAHTSNSFN